MSGKKIHRIVALKSKLFSVSLGDKQKISAKLKTESTKKTLKHPVFFRIFAQSALLRNCGKHNIFTIQTTQVSLSCSDGKQYNLVNGVGTIPFGHYSLREDARLRQVSGDIEWGDNVRREKKKKEEDNMHPIQSSGTELTIFPPPDPRFFKIQSLPKFWL